jgi:hypothetical protein
MYKHIKKLTVGVIIFTSLCLGTSFFSKIFASTLNTSISNQNDTGYVNTTGGSISPGYDGYLGYYAPGSATYENFYCFHVNLNKTVTINSAYLTLKETAGTTSGTINLKIAADTSINTSIYTSWNSYHTATLSNYVNWNNFPNTSSGNEVVTSPNIGSIIANNINNSSWSSGNNLCIQIQNNGSTGSRGTYKDANTINLQIDYSSPSPTPTPTPITITSDTFNRANSTTIGGNWVESGTAWEISSNTLINTRSDWGGEERILDNSTYPSNDYIVSFDYHIAYGSFTASMGTFFRYLNSTNYYLVKAGNNDCTLRLGKVVNGTWTQLGSTYDFANECVAGGFTHTLKVDVSGNQIGVYVDNVLKIGPVTDSTFTTGGTGLWTNGPQYQAGYQGYLDNFSSIYTPVPTPTPSPMIVASPATASATIGRPFAVDVVVNGGGQAFNAAKATVTASSNLSITGLMKPISNSCNFQYTQIPSVTNLSFAGAIFNTWSTNCKVYTITLTPTAAGTGTLTFTNGSIKSYANASEILSGVTNGSYTINSVTPTPTPDPNLGVNDTYTQGTYTSPFTLTGTKNSSITHVYVNESETGVTFPTSTTWQVSLTLAQGNNTFVVYGRDGSNNQTSSTSVVINKHALADINGDSVVDLTDASLFAVDWNKTSNLTYLLSDMTSDGAVDLTDFSILARYEQ